MLDFKYFFNKIFSKSFDNFIPGKHFDAWCDLIQNNQNSSIISPRKHGKSVCSGYAYTMWKLWQNPRENYEIVYISLNENLARMHTIHIKNLIRSNPFFQNCKDHSKSEGIIKCSWDGNYFFKIHPKGILSGIRGLHPNEVIVDDPLTDPVEIGGIMDLSQIEKINRTFKEVIYPLPKLDGHIRVVGTPQTNEDFFYKYKNSESTGWGFILNRAILNEATKEVLWEDCWNWEMLSKERKNIGEKAFLKEYMMHPVYSVDSYFSAKQLEKVIFQNSNKTAPNYDSTMKNYNFLETDVEVIGGMDIGKKSHPSHISIFEILKDGTWIQRFQKFLDGWEYQKQLSLILDLKEKFKINKFYFDNTRSEFEGFLESGDLDNNIFIPISFGSKNQHKMAVVLEKKINDGKIKFLPDQRQKESILQVSNTLKSQTSKIGHGDAFWSNCLAVSYEIEAKGGSMEFIKGISF